jgi:hypothetical protein
MLANSLVRRLPLGGMMARNNFTTQLVLRSTQAPMFQASRAISTVGLWKLRPYAGSNLASTTLSPMMSGVSLTTLSLFVAPPAQIAQMAITVPTVLGATYLTILAGQRLGSGGAYQHNYFSMFLYLVMSFLPVPCFQNLFADLMFTSFWLTVSYFAIGMLPELVLKEYSIALFVVAFMMPLFPLAFTFMPLMNTRSYLLL